MYYVVLAEYQDDLEAQVVRSLLFDADIDTELEQERPRGMKAHLEDTLVRVMVQPGDLDRARQLLRDRDQLFRLPPE